MLGVLVAPQSEKSIVLPHGLRGCGWTNGQAQYIRRCTRWGSTGRVVQAATGLKKNHSLIDGMICVEHLGTPLEAQKVFGFFDLQKTHASQGRGFLACLEAGGGVRWSAVGGGKKLPNEGFSQHHPHPLLAPPPRTLSHTPGQGWGTGREQSSLPKGWVS